MCGVVMTFSKLELKNWNDMDRNKNVDTKGFISCMIWFIIMITTLITVSYFYPTKEICDCPNCQSSVEYDCSDN